MHSGVSTLVDKTLNEMVPQLIPRDPVNSNGVKMPFHPLRTTVQTNEPINVEIDPTTSAPIAVLDGMFLLSPADYR